MDKDAENVAENRKYSFLLGSAIRNEDPNQFFDIYDAILPKNLPISQIECIKDKAREIADLPDEEFNQLFLNARDYSLAPDRKMSRTGRHAGFRDGSSQARHRGDLSSDEEEDLEHHDKFSDFIPPNVAFENCLRDHCGVEIDGYEKRIDNDSGICNSSKATTSIGSYSDQEYDSEVEEKLGIINYFPPQVKVHKECTGCSLDYDEAHEVEDSDKASQNDMDSPRYDYTLSKSDDTDFGTEMQTFRRDHKESDDFMTDDESEDEKFIPHRRLYHTTSATYARSSGTNYYSPMVKENSEEYGLSTSSLSFDRSKKALRNQTASSLRVSNRGVDDSISFPLTSTCPKSYGSTSSHGVRVETTYSRHYEPSTDFADLHPPFGQGSDQLGKVGSSISTLISNSPNTHISNLPEGRPILTQGSELGVENGKKRKKKKKGCKDDLDDKGKTKADYDENGNPCLNDHVLPILNSSYMQMREPPHPVDRGGTASKTRFRQNQNGFPSKLEKFENYTLSGQQVKELDDSSVAQTSESSNTRQKRQKRAKKEEKIIRAEEVENYVGDKNSIEELVKFIEQDNGGAVLKKTNKRINHTTATLPNTSTDIITVSVKNAEKNAKKGRDKKHKPSTNNKVSECAGGRERGDSISVQSVKEDENINKVTDFTKVGEVYKCEEIELEAIIVESPVTVQTQENSVVPTDCGSVGTMGNSYGHTSKEENGSTTADGSVIGQCDTVTTELKEVTCENNKEFPSKHVNQSNKMIQSVNNMKLNDAQYENDKMLEEKSVKNNKKKSVVVPTSPTGLHSNNKKSEKGKMGDEKNATSTNNIKQNNSKNSKVKEVSGDSVESEGHTKSDKVNVSSSKSSATVSTLEHNDLLSNENYSNYIFTDLDLPVAEPEFTVVGKKKKRPLGGMVQPVTSHVTKENSSIKNGHVGHRPVGRVERPRKQVQRSVTPPPGHSLSTTDSVDSERLRDLSPSSFPALSSSGSSINCGRQTFREGRRNSTGDVPCKEIVLRTQDDCSDIESVKSLPASQGGCSPQALSPRLPISYAKMAASPKPSIASISSNKTEESETCEETQDQCKEWKSAKWKGSLTERRHSIGSSPDNNVKETENSISTRPKYGGSQELLITADKEEEKVLSAASSNLDTSAVSGDTSVVDLEPVNKSASDSVLGSIVTFGDVLETTGEISFSNKLTNSLSDHNTNVTNLSPITVHKPTLSGVDVACPLSGCGVETVPPSSTGHVVKGPGECTKSPKEPNPVSGGQHTTKSLVPPSKTQTGNGKKVHKNKSVIFLDKRLNQVPKNLGITFGFELDVESIGASLSDQCSNNIVDSTSSTSSSSVTSVLSHQSGHSDSDVPCVDTSSVINPVHQHSHSETANEQCMSSTKSSSESVSNNNDGSKQGVFTNLSKGNITKISHTFSGKNGVVLPKKEICENTVPFTVETSDTSTTLCHDQTRESTIENKISSDPDLPTGRDPDLPTGSDSKSDHIVVYYGDSHDSELPSFLSASDKTQCARQLRFVPEKEVNKTRFNMAEAVSFVTREWDRFVQFKDKYPAKVVIYSNSSHS